MKIQIAGLFGALFAVTSFGQGTFTVSFDGPPALPVGTAKIITNYTESGVSLLPINNNGFVRNGGGVSGFPDDGSAYLQTLGAPAQGLVINLINGSSFGLVSVDLAEYSTVFPVPLTVQFTGYYADGSTVTTSFTTDGVIGVTGTPDFQTFLFPNKEWSGLKRVEIPTSGWSLDNLVVSVPEPATWALALCGAALLGLSRRLKKR